MIDSGAALIAGLVLLFIPIPFATWYSLTDEVFLFTGIVNLVYGFYSGTLVLMLVLRIPFKKFLIDLLITANFSWAMVCIGIIVWNWSVINGFGIAHMGFEGCFVVLLAMFEFYFVRPLAI